MSSPQSTAPRGSSRSGLRLRAAAAILLAAVALQACEETVEAPEASEEVPTETTQTDTVAKTKWLTVHDRIAPAAWLASREAGRDLPEDDPAVDAMRKRLALARETFGTDYRMTANRAVQLEEMIADEGWDTESAAELIESLSSAGASDTARAGFGQAAQIYFTLRKQGLSREEALRRLKEGGL